MLGGDASKEWPRFLWSLVVFIFIFILSKSPSVMLCNKHLSDVASTLLGDLRGLAPAFLLESIHLHNHLNKHNVHS